MMDPVGIETFLRQATPEQLYPAVASMFPKNATAADRAALVEAALRSPAGPMLRAEVGKWIVERFVPVEALVPVEYEKWRAPVRDAMRFVVSRLSESRLAAKIVEQMDLPAKTAPETRLLQLIAKVPGLQKLGQVLARNRHLRPSLRDALTQLENGIHDVTAEEMHEIIRKELGARLDQFAVRLNPAILSEASVSAVLRFTWHNPASGEREPGVFKVLKPYIPACFAEDMDILQGLAAFFGSRYREYGFAKHVLTDTFRKVRRLLQHEINFPGEQATLRESAPLYRSFPGVRVPQVIQPLCASNITALTEETGEKITDAVAHLPMWRRGQVAEQLIEAMIAVPLFAAEDSALFHADPHAGNVLYDPESGELTLLDWALTERLSREQRRHLAVLVFMVSLRDPVGAAREVEALSQRKVRRNSPEAEVIRSTVHTFLEKLPLAHLPGAVDAMRLLQQVATRGVRFPAALIMFSKVLFTLDGILEDIGGTHVPMALIMARHILQRWIVTGARPGLPLTLSDWIGIECSAIFSGARLSIKLEELFLGKLLSGQAADLIT